MKSIFILQSSVESYSLVGEEVLGLSKKDQKLRQGRWLLGQFEDSQCLKVVDKYSSWNYWIENLKDWRKLVVFGTEGSGG